MVRKEGAKIMSKERASERVSVRIIGNFNFTSFPGISILVMQKRRWKERVCFGVS